MLAEKEQNADRKIASALRDLLQSPSVAPLVSSRAQARGGAVEQDAQLQKEAADECRLKDQVREVTKRVAEGEWAGRVGGGSAVVQSLPVGWVPLSLCAPRIPM